MSTNFNENYWEKHYQQRGEGQVHLTPSPHLVSEVASLVPGTALDAGCGEGVDAIWLAQKGWRVTAVDISKKALDKAKHSAQEAGVDSDWRQADLTTYTLPENLFDLVICQYIHTTNDYALYKKVANAVKTGAGCLLWDISPRPHTRQAHMLRVRI